MEETITFWLDNKICSGFKIAEIGKQALVSYRDKYYIVVAGAALMKGVRPLHYSKTSMPLIWKKALKGILPPPVETMEHAEDEFLPVTTSTKKERTAMNKNAAPLSEQSEYQPLTTVTPQSVAKKSAMVKSSTDLKPVKIIQSVVATTCPYCNNKQDIPFEKGKSGKPFFTTCSKCSVDFAVRFVPVTMYQAQVAAFK
jgi:NMD protein affecting ribosome stability and mRNA decay